MSGKTDAIDAINARVVEARIAVEKAIAANREYWDLPQQSERQIALSKAYRLLLRATELLPWEVKPKG